MSRLRIAVVGAGHLGRIHAQIAAARPELQLVAVVDPVVASREQVAAATGAKPLAECRDLFGAVDAAIVATPTSTHDVVARELLRGGVHLLVEKPLTATVADADELVALARRQQLVLQVGHVERFNPALTSVRDQLHDPKYIEARRLSGYTGRSTDIGVVLDLMIHDIDVVLSLVQSPLGRVDALGISVLGDQEDVVNTRLQFESGCVANLTASRVSPTAERTMQVFTPTCAAKLDFAARKSSVVEPTDEILAREFQAQTLSPEQQAHLRERLFTDLLIEREVPATDVNAIEQQQLELAAAVRIGVQPQVTGSDGRDAIAIAERVLQQVAAHRWDGVSSDRHGAYASPDSPSVISAADHWAEDDTVILPRKAG